MLFFLLIVRFNVILVQINIIKYLFYHFFSLNFIKNNYHELVRLPKKLDFINHTIFFLKNINEVILLIILIKKNMIVFNLSSSNFKKLISVLIEMDSALN